MFHDTRTRKRLKPIDHLHRRNYCPVINEAVPVRHSDWPRAK